MSTLVTFIERAADLLAGVDGPHWKQLLASTWMATDGTGLKVIVSKLPAAHNGYIELYRNDETAVFQYEASKSGDIVAGKLRQFRGTLTADAEHRFNQLFASGRVIARPPTAPHPSPRPRLRALAGRRPSDAAALRAAGGGRRLLPLED